MPGRELALPNVAAPEDPPAPPWPTSETLPVPRPDALSGEAPVSAPPGRQVLVEGTFVPRSPLSGGGGSGRTARSQQSVARGREGKGYGLSRDGACGLHARGGGAAGSAGLRHRAGRGAGPGHAHVGGLDVPALRQQAGTGAGGARLHREAAELPDGRGLPAAARQAGGGLRPGLPRLLVGIGLVGAEAAGPLQLHLPALARPGIRATLAARARASGGRGPRPAAVQRRRNPGTGARGTREGRARGSAVPRRCPGRRGAGMGHADGVGAHGGPTGRAGGGSRGARLGPGALACSETRRRHRALRHRHSFSR